MHRLLKEVYGGEYKLSCLFIFYIYLVACWACFGLHNSRNLPRYGFYKMLVALYRNVKYSFAEEIMLLHIRWLYSPAAKLLFHLIVMKLDRPWLRSDCAGL